MLFNSIEFAFFLPIVFAVYWMLQKRLRVQNIWLLIASYMFYGWWDWRFLSLIAFSSIFDYVIALLISKETKPIKKKTLLFSSLFINLGLLGFFKYYNFFICALQDSFTLFGKELEVHSLNIILPVGISFYTFQTLSYTIDVYRNKMSASKDLLAFMAYVSFFPQLVAGPIERAWHLLPQFKMKRNFDYSLAVNGSKQILWGLFKKMVIADNCAHFANLAFDIDGGYSGIYLVAGSVFFAFQIYGDFSGYSDIAIGTAKLFGFDLMKNFDYPYFSRSISEFWRKWHISLSTWFRDYLYIPLGGNRNGKLRTIRNVLIVFTVSGFWHGANWTFILWGVFHGLLFIPSVIKKWSSNEDNSRTHSVRSSIHWFITFMLVCVGWTLFRAENISHLINYWKSMLSGLFSKEGWVQLYDLLYFQEGLFFVILVGIFFLMEYLGRNYNNPLELLQRIKSRAARWMIYYSIIILLFYCGGIDQDFIYFQF